MSHWRHLVAVGLLCASCAPSRVLEFKTEQLDFGAMLAGGVRSEPVQLVNSGESTLRVAGTSSSHPAFALAFKQGTRLEPNEPVTLTVNHNPPMDAREPQQATLRVWTDEGFEASLVVKSVPVAPDCHVPARIDFGPVLVGQTQTIQLPLRNPTALDSAAEVDRLSSLTDAFVFEHGRIAIRAGDEGTLAVSFKPDLTAELQGALSLRPHALCQAQRVELVGTGVIDFVVPSQTALFMQAPIGVTQAHVLTVKNRMLTPVALFDVQVREGSNVSDVFRVTRFPVRIPAAERSANGLLIPGEATIELTFTPTDLMTRFADLTFSTDLPAQPSIGVLLVGNG